MVGTAWLGIMRGGNACVITNKLRKENAYLRKSLDELKHVLEKILSLETLGEKNAQQLLARDQEICSLCQQAHVAGGRTVAGLQAQIDHYVRESLQAETEDVKNKLVSMSAKCQELESSRSGAGLQSCPSDGQVLTTSTAMSHDHLRDALEKNQQWLAYDQQREAYVKVVLARVFGLEQQLNQAKQALAQQHKDTHSEERSVQIQKHYEILLLTTKKEPEAPREQVNTAQRQLSELQCRYEEKQRVVGEVWQQLQAERLSIWQSVQKEKRRSGDREIRLWGDMEELLARLEEKEIRYRMRSETLDESFLECPSCRAQYPTRHHRELLAHLDTHSNK
uniref:TSG101 and ALIX binding domain-containing protein n=1 Tax=Oncorhynchus tshawytscha TaxID=74940 RepID=A0A8C8LU86_ONCTS